MTKLPIFKVVAGLVLAMVLVIGIQHVLYRQAIKKSAELSAANKSLTRINQISLAENKRLANEIKTVESAMAALAADQKRIIDRSHARLRDAENELIRLRVENEKIADFMSVPVPAEFLQWLRQTNRADGNRPR